MMWCRLRCTLTYIYVCVCPAHVCPFYPLLWLSAYGMEATATGSELDWSSLSPNHLEPVHQRVSSIMWTRTYSRQVVHQHSSGPQRSPCSGPGSSWPTSHHYTQLISHHLAGPMVAHSSQRLLVCSVSPGSGAAVMFSHQRVDEGRSTGTVQQSCTTACVWRCRLSRWFGSVCTADTQYIHICIYTHIYTVYTVYISSIFMEYCLCVFTKGTHTHTDRCVCVYNPTLSTTNINPL